MTQKFFMYVLLFIYANIANAQINNIEKTIPVDCSACPEKLEISGLISIEGYLFLIPQNDNTFYYYSFKELSENPAPAPSLLPFKAEILPKDSQGWEAVTYKKIDDHLYTFYFILERCDGDLACLYSARVKFNKHKIPSFSIDSLVPFSSPLQGKGNLSYEAITWIENKDLDVNELLVIPEHITHSDMNPLLITEDGRQRPVQTDGHFDYFRISDMTSIKKPNGSYRLFGVSFCWKGLNSAFKNSDNWCFKNNDEWTSKLTLFEFKLTETQSDTLRLTLVQKTPLHPELIPIEGPKEHHNHEYNAEGLAISPKGEMILVNDNYPDGPYTELRFVAFKTFYE